MKDKEIVAKLIKKSMTESVFEEYLANLLEMDDDVQRVESYETVGMLTRDKGLAVFMKDGSGFDITIQQTNDEYEKE